jgi:hypothetical protein
MTSLKKRLVVGIALLMLLISAVVPVGAQDSTLPSTGTSIVTLESDGSGFMVTLSLPIRCGNNC